MKRSLQFYLAALTVANALLGWGGVYLSRALRSAYVHLLKGADFPLMTVQALRLPPVFFALALATLVFAIWSWWKMPSGSVLVHVGIGIVALGFSILIYLLIGYVLPFFTLTWKL